MQAYKGHPMWELPPFNLPDFQEYATEQLSKAADLLHKDTDTLINQMALAGEQRCADLLSVSARQVATLTAGLDSVNTELTEVKSCVRGIAEAVGALMTHSGLHVSSEVLGPGRPAGAPGAASQLSAIIPTYGAVVGGSAPMYVNQLGDLRGRAPTRYNGTMRYLQDHEIPNLSTFNGPAGFEEFCKWWCWGTATAPPPLSVVQWSHSRTLTGTRGKKRSRIADYNLMYQCIADHANQKVNRALPFPDRLAIAWNHWDRRRNGTDICAYVDNILKHSVEWAAAKIGWYLLLPPPHSHLLRATSHLCLRPCRHLPPVLETDVYNNSAASRRAKRSKPG